MYYLCFEIRDLQEILGSFVWINTHNTLRSQICAEGDATVLVDPAGWRIHEASLSIFFQNSGKSKYTQMDAFSMVLQTIFPFSPSHATFNVLL